MAVDYNDLRSVMLDYLKTHPRGQFNLISDSIQQFYTERGFPMAPSDFETLKQIIHEFYLERILVPGYGRDASGAWRWPFYRLTDYGKRVVDNPEYQPHDPTGYLNRIQNEVSTIDPVIVHYLEEALNCYRGSLLLAAAVMIGCAAEKAMLLLVDAFGSAISDAKDKAKYEREVKSLMISRKYDALWKRLEPLESALPNSLGDDLHVILDRVFDLIRTTRNEAGHPTGKRIERETIHANLLLFPSYCKRVYKLIEHFSCNQV